METKEGFYEPDGLELPIDQYSKKVFTAVDNTDEPVAFYSEKEPKLPPVIVKDHFVKTQLIIALKPKIKKKWVFGIHNCKHNKIKGLELINKVIKNNEPINFEWKSRKADYSLFWTEIGLSKVKISGVTRILAVIRDITDKKKAILNLKESEERFRNLAETTSTSIMLFQNNNCIYANPSAEKLLGYNYNKLKNINYLKLIASKDRDKIKNLNNHYFKKNKKPVSNGFEIRIITKNGIRKWVYIQWIELNI